MQFTPQQPALPSPLVGERPLGQKPLPDPGTCNVLLWLDSGISTLA